MIPPITSQIATRRQRIIEMLKEYPDGMTCREICKIIVAQEEAIGLKPNAVYMSGAISSVLLRMREDDEVRVHQHVKGVCGGMVFIYPMYAPLSYPVDALKSGSRLPKD